MSDETPSQPPAVKVINAWNAFAAMVFAALVELYAMYLAGQAHSSARMSTELFVTVLGICVTGKGIAQARKQVPMPTLMLVGGAAAWLAHRLQGTALVVLLALFASGCPGFLPVAKSAMDAILPAARDALVKEAERRDTDLDANEAICFAAPEEYQPDDYLLVTCIAPAEEPDE